MIGLTVKIQKQISLSLEILVLIVMVKRNSLPFSKSILSSIDKWLVDVFSRDITSFLIAWLGLGRWYFSIITISNALFDSLAFTANYLGIEEFALTYRPKLLELHHVLLYFVYILRLQPNEFAGFRIMWYSEADCTFLLKVTCL